MNAAVVELDALAYAVGSSAEHHDLPAVAHRDHVGRVVGGVVVRGVFHPTHRDGLKAVFQAKGQTLSADLSFGDAGEFGQIEVGEAVFLGAGEEVVGEGGPRRVRVG